MNISRDIQLDFPDIKGFSVRNLNYMRRFAEIYTDFSKVQRGVALLPWRNNITIITKIKDETARDWYIQQNLENGWNNTVLIHQIEYKLYNRQVLAEKASNFEKTLPSPQSELAQETLKNPYIFDFVEKRKGIIEREIERELVANIAKTIMELGTGFAFYGNQNHIEVSGKDYYIDLLFYETRKR
jgi:predicted nuclease of restriction endonuclease-like (RecB) superfamily